MVSDQNTDSNMIKITWTTLQDLRFSQQCCWRFQSHEGFDTFAGQLVPSASRAQQSFETSGTTYLMTQRHIIKAQNTSQHNYENLKSYMWWWGMTVLSRTQQHFTTWIKTICFSTDNDITSTVLQLHHLNSSSENLHVDVAHLHEPTQNKLRWLEE